MSNNRPRPIVPARHLAEAHKIALRFPEFTDGCRVVTLISRKNDGNGNQPHRTLHSMISRKQEEWEEMVARLLQLRELYPDLCTRLYQTVNRRDVMKGIRCFKERQIAADHQDGDGMRAFYLSVKNSLISAIMQPECAATKLFLFDCDTKHRATVNLFDEALIARTQIVKIYETKNGYHFITKPFDPSKINLPKEVELKRDALMLLHFDG